MPELRTVLAEAGFADVQTYVQSGNVDVIVRTAEELAAVVSANPLADVADNPKRYQVSFLDVEPDPEVVERISGLAVDGERLVVLGREVYTWHPAGVARSKLAAKLAAAGGLGVRATARNWTTVTTLLELAGES